MAFTSGGDFICDVKFESGAVERPSDISINDDGVIAITSLKGQVSFSFFENLIKFFESFVARFRWQFFVFFSIKLSQYFLTPVKVL